MQDGFNKEKAVQLLLNSYNQVIGQLLSLNIRNGLELSNEDLSGAILPLFQGLIGDADKPGLISNNLSPRQKKQLESHILKLATQANELVRKQLISYAQSNIEAFESYGSDYEEFLSANSKDITRVVTSKLTAEALFPVINTVFTDTLDSICQDQVQKSRIRGIQMTQEAYEKSHGAKLYSLLKEELRKNPSLDQEKLKELFTEQDKSIKGGIAQMREKLGLEAPDSEPGKLMDMYFEECYPEFFRALKEKFNTHVVGVNHDDIIVKKNIITLIIEAIINFLPSFSIRNRSEKDEIDAIKKTFSKIAHDIVAKGVVQAEPDQQDKDAPGKEGVHSSRLRIRSESQEPLLPRG